LTFTAGKAQLLFVDGHYSLRGLKLKVSVSCHFQLRPQGQGHRRRTRGFHDCVVCGHRRAHRRVGLAQRRR
jgi:hypothetical protein